MLKNLAPKLLISEVTEITIEKIDIISSKPDIWNDEYLSFTLII